MNTFAGTALLAWLLVGQVAATELPDPNRIARAVQQLSDADFSTRQQATILLWEMGKAAEPALRRAVQSPDREVAYRARQILDKFKFGIYADTPPETVRLINQYRDGDANVRREVMNQLQQRGETNTMMSLIEAEADDELRQQLTSQILRDVEKIIPKLIQEDDQRVEQLLALGSSSNDGMTLYLSYLVLRGKADEKIAALQAQRRDGGLEASDARLLGYLLRATGDLTAARDAAESAGDETLLKTVLFDLADWQALAKLEDDPNVVASLSSYALVERLGFIAAYYRLAGDEAKLNQTLDKMRELSESDSLRWYCGEALLINGRFQEGIDLLRESHQATVFRLLTAQARYREAFALIEMGPTREDSDAWFSQVVRDAVSPDKETRERFEVGLQTARALVRVGRIDDARRYFAQLADAVKDDEDGHKQRLRSLIAVETKSGLRDLALEHTALALAMTKNTYPLNSAYPDHYESASLWWEFLTNEFPGQSRLETLQQIDRLVLGRGDKFRLEELQALADAAERHAAGLDESRRGKLLYEVASALPRHGHREAAEPRMRAAAEFSAEAAVKLGDWAADREAWQQAADWYARAWERDGTHYFALYLHGRMLREMGQTESARKKMDLAKLLPLSPQTRRAFATKLQERGFKEEAAENWWLLLRTGDFQNWYTNDAGKNLGNVLSAKDPLRAAEGWQRLLLSALKTSSAFTEVEGYLQLPQLIHKVRARALLKAGRQEEAVAELRISHAALPGGIKLAEDLFPQFDEAGLTAVVDELFSETFTLYQALCEDYPDVATHHNNLAWLAARCDRQLDTAFIHAQNAVELAPGSTAYVDTLAEVHFRRGDADEAIRLARECLESEPENEHFQRQLRRFQGEAVPDEE